MQTKAINFRDLFRYEKESGFLYWRVRGKKRSVTDPAGTKTNRGYVAISVCEKKFYRHRIVWAIHYGKLPELGLDHINGIKGDDRIENLRIATTSQNGFNRTKTKANKSGFKGAWFDKKRGQYRSRIVTNGRETHLGYFEDASKAHEAYLTAAEKLHAEFCKL